MTLWDAHIDGAEEYYIISMHTGYDMVSYGIGIHYMGVINDDNKPGHLFDLEPIRAIAIWADTCEIALHWSDDTGEIVGPFGRANVDHSPIAVPKIKLVVDRGDTIVSHDRRSRHPCASASKAELRKELRRLRSQITKYEISATKGALGI
jgi:hypothetical protein